MRVLMLAGLLIAVPSQALPCTCSRTGPPCQDVWQSDVVFVGTAVDGPIDWWTRFFHEFGSVITTFRVDDGIRGINTGGIVRVSTTLGGCGFWFNSTQSYVVYARYDRHKVLRTGSCGRTQLASEATIDIEYFKALRAGRAPTRIYGFVTLDGRDTGFGGGASATQPVAGVPIEVRQDGTVWSAVTGLDGAFSFSDLPPGKFRLIAHLTNPSDPWEHNGAERTVELRPGACAEEIFEASGPQDEPL
jgi:hypothetical protein